MRSPVTSTAALPQPAILGVLQASFPAGASRSLAVWGSAGLGAGAILGGLLTTVSWRLTFAINVPFTFLGALGGARWLSSTRDRTTGHCPAGVRLDARHRHRAHTRPSPTILFGPSSAAEGASNPSSPASRPAPGRPGAVVNGDSSGVACVAPARGPGSRSAYATG